MGKDGPRSCSVRTRHARQPGKKSERQKASSPAESV